MVSFGFSIVGLGIGSSAAFILHKLNPTWFCEVCPSSDPPLQLLDVNEWCDVGAGSDGLKASHLDHDDCPFPPLLLYRSCGVLLLNW